MSKKYMSKYIRKTGYSTKDLMNLLGWSYGTVWNYLQDKGKRKIMIDLARMEEKNRD